MRRLVVAAALTDSLTRPSGFWSLRRGPGSPLAGEWELPGGKVEPGETPTAALARELAEELDLHEVSLGPELPGPVQSSHGKVWPINERLCLRVWWARAEREPVARVDHDDARWLTAPTALDVAWLPADLALADALAAELRRIEREPGRGLGSATDH